MIDSCLSSGVRRAAPPAPGPMTEPESLTARGGGSGEGRTVPVLLILFKRLVSSEALRGGGGPRMTSGWGLSNAGRCGNPRPGLGPSRRWLWAPGPRAAREGPLPWEPGGATKERRAGGEHRARQRERAPAQGGLRRGRRRSAEAAAFSAAAPGVAMATRALAIPSDIKMPPPHRLGGRNGR